MHWRRQPFRNAGAKYLRKLSYNQANIGFNIIYHMFVKGAAKVLAIGQLSGEVATLRRFLEGQVQYSSTDGKEQGFYAIETPDEFMGYTEFIRNIPILSSAAGRVIADQAGGTDKGWQGFGKLDSPLVDQIVDMVKESVANAGDLVALLGAELAKNVTDTLSGRYEEESDSDSSYSSDSFN